MTIAYHVDLFIYIQLHQCSAIELTVVQLGFIRKDNYSVATGSTLYCFGLIEPVFIVQQ